MTENLSTSEKRLLKRLHESERFVNQVANNIPDIVYVFDIKTRRMVYTNKRVMDILGPENLQLNIMHPNDYFKRMDQLSQCANLGEGEISDIDIRLLAKGDWGWFRIRDIAFKHDNNGNVSQVIGIVRDIREKKNN
jgi:PAS domain S-box-containing protein